MGFQKKKKKKKIRKIFHFRDGIDKRLQELEKKNSLTEQEIQDKKHYTEKLKKTEEFPKKLKEEDLNRLESINTMIMMI